MLSHYWSNNWMLKVIKIGDMPSRTSQIGMAGVIVRNDEVVGSIPTSSTKF
jgi:hypothetical protein